MTEKEVIKTQDTTKLFPAFPVALVTAGENVASYGLIHIFSFEPMLIGVGVRRSRHTYDMIEKTGDFGVNLPGKDLVDAVNICGKNSGRDVEKFSAAKITMMPASKIKSVLVEECLYNLECRVYKKLELPGATHDWFIGEVVAVHGTPGAKADDVLMYWNAKYALVGDAVGSRRD